LHFKVGTRGDQQSRRRFIVLADGKIERRAEVLIGNVQVRAGRNQTSRYAVVFAHNRTMKGSAEPVALIEVDAAFQQEGIYCGQIAARHGLAQRSRLCGADCETDQCGSQTHGEKAVLPFSSFHALLRPRVSQSGHKSNHCGRCRDRRPS
jgi:hypothetical protein